MQAAAVETRRRRWPLQLAWLAGVGLLAYADTAVFAGLLGLPRRVYLIPHLSLTTALAYGWLHWNGVSVRNVVTRRWRSGLLWAAAFSSFALWKVLSHPASATAQGWRLAFDLLWSGLAYGLADAVLLTILPVLIVSHVFATAGLSNRVAGRVAMRAVALLASLAITLMFHLGFPKLGDKDYFGAALGNGVMTVGYVTSGSLLTPAVSHVVVHTGAVLRGPGTTPLLPPH